jgi:hypothetical protein
MRVVEERLPMCFYHQNVIFPPYSFRDMLLSKETHQCDRRSLPWEHLPRGQNCICCTCFHRLKGLHIGRFVIGAFYFTNDGKTSLKCAGTCTN